MKSGDFEERVYIEEQMKVNLIICTKYFIYLNNNKAKYDFTNQPSI